MRLGAMQFPQVFGQCIGVSDDEKEVVGACALATVALSEGLSVVLGGGVIQFLDQLLRLYPVLLVVIDCPVHNASSGCRGQLWLMIVHLNDQQRWSREQIADFIETIEAAQETPVEETVAVTA